MHTASDTPGLALLRRPVVLSSTVMLCAAGAGFVVEAVRLFRGARLVSRLQPDPAVARPARPDGA